VAARFCRGAINREINLGAAEINIRLTSQRPIVTAANGSRKTLCAGDECSEICDGSPFER
jgi:hypothetical protein